MDKLTSIFHHTPETTMNTACSPCITSPLPPSPTRRFANTWLASARARWSRWTASRQPQRAESELTALDGLTPETLKDIGAPEWVQARALRAQERARQGSLFERESLHWR